jgi:tRNA 5-methylaminomethyl-2-thiouridine biosynthesis bifunctional protein
LVIGAGLAGAAMAQCLTTRGWRVDLFDAGSGPAQAASALPVGMLSLHVTRAPTPLSELSALGVAHTRTELQRLLPQGRGWQSCEVDNLGHDAGRWPAALVRPSALVQAWLAEAQATGRLRCHWNARVQSLQTIDGGWRLQNADQATLGEAPTAVLTAALGSSALLQGVSGGTDWRPWPLHPVKGQMSLGLQSGEPLAPRPQRNNGVFVPRYDDADMPAPWPQRLWSMGSTYDRGQRDTVVNDEAHARNADSLRAILPTLPAPIEKALGDAPWQGWAQVRCASLDRLPMAGAVPDVAALQAQLNRTGAQRTRITLTQVPRLDGLYTLCALGSRGLTLAHWCAQQLALQMEHQANTAPPDLWRCLDPARFVWKQSRRQETHKPASASVASTNL